MGRDIVWKPIAELYGQSVSSISVVQLSDFGEIPTGALKALIQVETTAIRCQFNATDSVTSGTGGGYKIAADAEKEIEGRDFLTRMRMIGDGGDSSINIIYYGEQEYQT